MGRYGDEQKRLDEVMPWIGLYIAAASVVCTVAMAADAFNGFRRRKLWFPCKYFSLNAASLTVLAVAMKLPVDLDTNFYSGTVDEVAKFSSLIFMSTAMGNFFSSLGSMNDKEILSNIVALVILVITIVVNVWIQLYQLKQPTFNFLSEDQLTPTILMLLLLATLVSSAIMVPASKRSLEAKYREMHKVALREEETEKRREAFIVKKQMIAEMKKYWVMAETSNPQFVMARSVVSTTSSVICLLAAMDLVQIHIQWLVVYGNITHGWARSVYGWYTKLIVVVQFTGVVVGTIAPTWRWFIAGSFKCSTISLTSFKKEFKVENHWIQTLVDWRDSFSALQIRQDKARKHLHDAKCFILNFCIGVQILIVLFSKLLVFISALLISPSLLCFNRIKKFMVKCSSTGNTSNNFVGPESDGLCFSRYVLLLEGEAELPEWTLKSICHRADKVIQTGKKQQPQHIIHLLQKFNNFNGVRDFDSIQVPRLHPQEPPNCWTLPLVTLTSIAIALPNVASHKSKQLVSSMSEGLSLAKLIDKTLDIDAQLLNIRNAADVAWVGVALYGKWQDINLRRISQTCKNSKDLLQKLSDNAKMTVMEFERKTKDFLMGNPVYWPVKVIVANSMYRISQTILLSCQGENEVSDEQLFGQLSAMIANILAACLANLPRLITNMCHHNAIEKREESVHKAFLLLGETEQILQLLQEQWPSLDHGKATSIEEWRTLLLRDNESSRASTPMPNGEQITVMVDC